MPPIPLVLASDVVLPPSSPARPLDRLPPPFEGELLPTSVVPPVPVAPLAAFPEFPHPTSKPRTADATPVLRARRDRTVTARPAGNSEWRCTRRRP